MPTPVNPTGTPAQRLALIVLAPIVFVVLCDIVIRVSGVDTSVARNRNFEIGVPTWLLGDENWVDIQRGRMDEPDGVRAEDVAWLQHFEEARYITVQAQTQHRGRCLQSVQRYRAPQGSDVSSPFKP